MGNYDHYNQDDLAAAAKAEAQRWNSALRRDGQGDADKVAHLMRRSDVICMCVRSPLEVRSAIAYGIAVHDATEAELAVHARAKVDDPLIRRLRGQILDTLPDRSRAEGIDVVTLRSRTEAIQKRVDALDPPSGVWDYYLLAYYTSAYAGVKVEERHPFLQHSLFPAFKAGLGNVFDFDGLQVGVLLPEFHLDDRDRLHREDGPAVRYQDGYETYWWHGLEVPREVIMEPDSIDPKDVLKLDNAETKRAYIEILGWECVLKPLNLTKIASDDWGDLLQLPAKVLDDDDGRDAFFVRVTCPSTGREYLNRISPDDAASGSPVACIARRFSVAPEDFIDAQHS